MLGTFIVLILLLLIHINVDAFVVRQQAKGFKSIKRLRHDYKKPVSRKIHSSSALAAFDPEAFANAFSIGAVSTMAIALWAEGNKVKEAAEEENCPYCLGNGEILCALCFGTGINPQNANEDCPCCEGRGLVTCVNCKGDGRSMPLVVPPAKTGVTANVTMI
jgi:hypothetical protein